MPRGLQAGDILLVDLFGCIVPLRSAVSKKNAKWRAGLRHLAVQAKHDRKRKVSGRGLLRTARHGSFVECSRNLRRCDTPK